MTTFRRDGTPVSTAVWVVPLNEGKLGIRTSSGSGKAKRLAHTDRVTIQPSDARGRVKGGFAEVEGTARLATGAEYDVINAKVNAKYGIMNTVTKALGAIGGLVKRKRIPYGDCGVVLTPV